jgi:transposase InsO family protein
MRQRAEDVLVGEIRILHAGSRGAYGVPRIHAALRRAGRLVNEKKVERLMRVHHITGITRRRRRGLTRQAKRAVIAADLIGRDFTAPHPGMRLVGDMTELLTLEGKLYLATCIDLATREVTGWALADHHRAELPVAALRMAAGRGDLEEGCVMHTDRGSEGGFNWSSQHLDHGGVGWDDRGSRCRRCRPGHDGSGPRIGRCGRPCARPAVRSRRALCSGSSGA